jgi:hypothetical protein
MYFEPIDHYTHVAIHKTLAFEANHVHPDNRLINRFHVFALWVPPEDLMIKFILQVCRNDCDEDGIAREIMWFEKLVPVDKYGLVLDEEPRRGMVGCLFNHGTREKPSWSSHT